MAEQRILIIGAGLIGLATAYKLARRYPNLTLTVLEKEPQVAMHQSGRNSGVLHAGLYYTPNSLKAKLAVDGIRQMTAFCREHGIAHEICGKIVVATNDDELPRLHNLFERGRTNGLRDVTWLSGEELRAIEPYAAGIAALRVPEEGIADYRGIAAALVREIERLGGSVRTGTEVTRLVRNGNAVTAWTAETTTGAFSGDILVNCGGLHCDRIARMAGEHVDIQIIPFRGEYYKLRPDRETLVRHLIYPVPDPIFPFLGVHFTRMIFGGIECGPNAVLALAREGYRRGAIAVRDLAETVAFPGLWRFVANHASTTWKELQRSHSQALFARALARLVPAIATDDLIPGGVGIRAQAMRRDGTLVEDFAFADRPNALHVLNAPSPGATASLAIADEVVQRLSNRIRLTCAVSAE